MLRALYHSLQPCWTLQKSLCNLTLRQPEYSWGVFCREGGCVSKFRPASRMTNLGNGGVEYYIWLNLMNTMGRRQETNHTSASTFSKTKADAQTFEHRKHLQKCDAQCHSIDLCLLSSCLTLSLPACVQAERKYTCLCTALFANRGNRRPS